MRCVFFRDLSRWAMSSGVVALAVLGSPTMAQGEPINDCFGKVVDHASASQISGDLLLLKKQVFPVAGYASVQGLSDDRILDIAARQSVAQLTPIYQNCVKESYAEIAEPFDELHKSHLAARVLLLRRLADGAFTYA